MSDNPPPVRVVILQTVWGVSAEGVTGGGTYHFAELAELWKKRGVEVWLITNSYDHGGSIYKDIDRVLVLPSRGLVSHGDSISIFREYFENFLIQRRKLVSLVKENTTKGSRPIILPFSSFPSDVLAGFYLHRKLNACTIVYMHVVPPPPWWCTFKRGSVLRHTTVWALTQFAFLLIKLGRLPMTVDQSVLLRGSSWRFTSGFYEDWAFLPPAIVPPAQNVKRDVDVVFIGALDQRKGVLDLARAWVRVIRRCPGSKLIIAGHSYSTSYATRVRSILSSAGGASSVEFLGYLSESEKQALLNRAKLFVYPSYEESWSRAVMEAILHGCLPVTWDLPAYNYLGAAAVKVPAGNEEKLASAIVDFLSSPKERNERLANLATELKRIKAQEIADFQLKKIMQFYSAESEPLRSSLEARSAEN